MFCGTFAGMLVIGNLKPMALAAGIPSVPAAVTISAFALGNAAGRITWGWISDRADERMIPVKMAALGIPLVLLIWTHSSVVFIFLSFAVGFGFGASFVVYAAQVASKYGPGRVSGIYPVVFLAYGAAGLTGPAAGGWMYDVTSSYTPAILLSSGVLASGLIATAWLLRRAKYSRAGQLGR
jgi:OFA family oxalate/formate antiporter-like MFS transporter